MTKVLPFEFSFCVKNMSHKSTYDGRVHTLYIDYTFFVKKWGCLVVEIYLDFPSYRYTSVTGNVTSFTRMKIQFFFSEWGPKICFRFQLWLLRFFIWSNWISVCECWARLDDDDGEVDATTFDSFDSCPLQLISNEFRVFRENQFA